MKKILIVLSKWPEILCVTMFILILFASVKNVVKPVQISYGKELETELNDVDVAESMSDYLERQLYNTDATIVITVKDIQGYNTESEFFNILESVGVQEIDILALEEYHSFIAVISHGQVIFQKVGGDELISVGQDIDNHYVFARSATLNAGNTGEVYIDNVQYAVNGRGFNIVVADLTNNKLIDSISYDVYLEDIPEYRLNNGSLIELGSTHN